MNNMNVMGRRMFENPNGPVRMQEGGMAPLMPPGAMMPPGPPMMPPGPPPGPPPGAMMPPGPPMMPQDGMMPPGPPMMPPGAMMESQDGVAALLADQGIEPAMMEQMLASATENFGDLDSAQDFEQAMNAVRGDALSISERRGELAQYVGPDDANQTPDSVLTLVQPVMMMAGVDEGIGGLAQGQMTEPVTGDMAQGIMSTVDMGGMQGDQPPVNFNQGGAVQRFADNIDNRVAGASDFDMDRIKSLYEQQRELAQQLIPSTLSAEDLAQDKRLSEGQMMFDLANAGLQLAQAGPSGENFLGAVARAATDSQLFDKVGARAQQFRGLEREARKERQAVDLMAFKSAQDLYGTERAYDAAIANLSKGQGNKNLSPLYNVFVGEGDNRKQVRTNIPLTNSAYANLKAQLETDNPKQIVTVEPYAAGKSVTTLYNLVDNATDKVVEESVVVLDTDMEDLKKRNLRPVEVAEGTVGSATDTSQFNVIDLLLPSYSKGTISPEDQLKLEFVLSDIYGPKPDIQGVMQVMARPLAVDQAVQERLNLGLDVPTKLRGNAKRKRFEETARERLSKKGLSEPEKKVIYDSLEFGSQDFLDTLINEQGTQVNFDNPNWKKFTPVRFAPEVGEAYEKAFGLAKAPQLFANSATSIFRELGMDTTMSKEGFSLVAANKDFESLRRELVAFAGASDVDPDGSQRILKSVQDMINNEFQALSPTIFGTSDEKAAGVLDNVKKQLGLQYVADTKKLAEYGGDGTVTSSAKVGVARDRIRAVRSLLVDVIFFEDALRASFAGPDVGTADPAEAGRSDLRGILRDSVKKKQF